MNWKEIFKIIWRGIGYTIAYFVGRGDALKSLENQSDKQALEEATKVLEKREKIREKTSRLKRALPNDWVRKAQG